MGSVDGLDPASTTYAALTPSPSPVNKPVGCWLIGDNTGVWHAALTEVDCRITRYGDTRVLTDLGQLALWVEKIRLDPPAFYFG